MRIMFGVMFVTYGLRKLGLLDQAAVPLVSQMGAAALIETMGGALIAVGLYTRPAAFIAAGEMAFAYFLSHADRAPLPVQNNGIPAVLFCFAFLYIATQGSGPYGVDALRGGRVGKSRREPRR
jgi:putative oxidoreductase